MKSYHATSEPEIMQYTYNGQKLWIEQKLGASNIHCHDQLPVESSFIHGNLWLACQHTAF